VSEIRIETLRTRLEARIPTVAVAHARIEAAVAIILVPHEHDLDILLIRRAEVTGDPWSGQMALPGGRRDAEDTDLLATAIRETREETGIALAPNRLLGELDDLAPTLPVLPPVLVRPFVFSLDRRLPVHPSHEVALTVWTSLPRLLESERDVRVRVRSETRRVSAFHVGPHVVWGMTYHILNNLNSLVTARS
jgi:8-oxo-dGTP pyrophosphatase MutT (NUDIX family)